MTASKVITREELAAKNSKESCWVAIHGKVYDLTEFLKEHPGGSKVILREAGKDGTAAFAQIHPEDIISRILPETSIVGILHDFKPNANNAEDAFKQIQSKNPPISTMLNLQDFEELAERTMKPEAWAYYSGGSEDEITLYENHAAFHRIWIKPRILINVKKVDTTTTILGCHSSLPFYVSATALGKLGHPEGEVVLTRAAGKKKIIQMIPTLASCSLEELTSASVPGQTQFFQLYVNQDRKITESLIKRAESQGCKGLFITVDAPQLGRREKDMRMKFIDDAPDAQANEEVSRNEGAARAITSYIDPALCWDDIKWFKSVTKMPIVLKGVQCAEDAVLAAKYGCAGIVLSNHGGRQLETSRSAIEILPDVMSALKNENLAGKLEVYIDGGIRRGTDIFKALALGAKAVGLGRPFLYGMSTYGQKGVERIIDLLSDELEMVMRLAGAPTLSHAVPAMLDIGSLQSHCSGSFKTSKL
ncbi:hypothetical protein HK096_003025 [Nowakowskiella sp. JEL0078]|nr:hypothetical protein HK096_003025 [Nowakowskiella sp. JEL0078]